MNSKAPRVETVTLPAFLASALINGDTSGLERQYDLDLLQEAYDYVAPGTIVSCSDEPFFQRGCDLPGFTQGADMLEYTVFYTD